MRMNKKGQGVNILSVVVGMLVFAGIFISLFIFKSSMFVANNVTGIEGYNNTYDEMNKVVEVMHDNNTIDQFDGLFRNPEDNNVSGAGITEEDEMYEKSKIYGFKYIAIAPMVIGMAKAMFLDVGIPTVIISIVATILISLVAYVIMVFIRKGS